MKRREPNIAMHPKTRAVSLAKKSSRWLAALVSPLSKSWAKRIVVSCYCWQRPDHRLLRFGQLAVGLQFGVHASPQTVLNLLDHYSHKCYIPAIIRMEPEQ